MPSSNHIYMNENILLTILFGVPPTLVQVSPWTLSQFDDVNQLNWGAPATAISTCGADTVRPYRSGAFPKVLFAKDWYVDWWLLVKMIGCHVDNTFHETIIGPIWKPVPVHQSRIYLPWDVAKCWTRLMSINKGSHIQSMLNDKNPNLCRLIIFVNIKQI